MWWLSWYIITVSYLVWNQNHVQHIKFTLSDSNVFNIIANCNLWAGLSCLLMISIWTRLGCAAKTDIVQCHVERRISVLRLAFAGARRKFHKIDCDWRAGKPHSVYECVHVAACYNEFVKQQRTTWYLQNIINVDQIKYFIWIYLQIFCLFSFKII